jgi:hypothetical protein
MGMKDIIKKYTNCEYEWCEERANTSIVSWNPYFKMNFCEKHDKWGQDLYQKARDDYKKGEL